MTCIHGGALFVMVKSAGGFSDDSIFYFYFYLADGRGSKRGGRRRFGAENGWLHIVVAACGGLNFP